MHNLQIAAIAVYNIVTIALIVYLWNIEKSQSAFADWVLRHMYKIIAGYTVFCALLLAYIMSGGEQ